jgi:hypothetical protein
VRLTLTLIARIGVRLTLTLIARIADGCATAHCFHTFAMQTKPT